MAKRPVDPDKLTSDPRVEDPALSRGKDDAEIEDILSGLGEKSSPHRPEYDEFQDRGDVDSMLGSPSDSKFGKIPEDPADAEEAKHAAKHAEQMAEIDKLLKEVEASQDKQRKRQGHGRAQAYAINAGEAMRAGFMGEKGNYVDVPAKYDVAAGTEKKIALGDKLKNAAMNYESKEDERDLRKLLGEEGNKNKANIAHEGNVTKENVENSKIERDIDKTNQVEGGRNTRNDKLIKANIGRTAMGINAQAGSQGQRADADFANRQAERQVPGYDQIKANSATDQTKAADLAGSQKAINDVAIKAISVMRKNGPNFPKSTEWLKLESTMMTLNEELTKLHANGVMNFKDKDNNDIEIGEPQKFLQYMMQNGPDVLEHAMSNLKMSVDAKMYHHGYKSNPNWKEKKPSEYLGDASGGGSSRSGVDPNVAPDVANWALNNGPAPAFNNPAKDVKAPGSSIPPRKDSGARKFHWDEKTKSMLDQNGMPL